MAGKVNESLWRICRLRPGTVEQLRTFEKKLRASYERGDHANGPDDQDRISIDALVGELLRRDREHERRSTEAWKRRRKGKKSSE